MKCSYCKLLINSFLSKLLQYDKHFNNVQPSCRFVSKFNGTKHYFFLSFFFTVFVVSMFVYLLFYVLLFEFDELQWLQNKIFTELFSVALYLTHSLLLLLDISLSFFFLCVHVFVKENSIICF